MSTRLPNFRGRRALVLHRKDKNSETLVRQLRRLGLTVQVAWPASNISAEGYDVVFFDADLGYEELFAWSPEEPPIPLVALMGSEAPGRIEWTLSQTPSAYLVKPLGSTGVFIALAIAFHTFETRQQLKTAIDELSRRVKARPLVFRALLIVMERFGLDETQAFELLRSESMNRRLAIEDLSALLASNEGDLEALKPKARDGQSPGKLTLIPGRSSS